MPILEEESFILVLPLSLLAVIVVAHLLVVLLLLIVVISLLFLDLFSVSQQLLLSLVKLSPLLLFLAPLIV